MYWLVCNNRSIGLARLRDPSQSVLSRVQFVLLVHHDDPLTPQPRVGIRPYQNMQVWSPTGPESERTEIKTLRRRVLFNNNPVDW